MNSWIGILFLTNVLTCRSASCVPICACQTCAIRCDPNSIAAGQTWPTSVAVQVGYIRTQLVDETFCLSFSVCVARSNSIHPRGTHGGGVTIDDPMSPHRFNRAASIMIRIRKSLAVCSDLQFFAALQGPQLSPCLYVIEPWDPLLIDLVARALYVECPDATV